MQPEDENMKESVGQSSFDLASNKPDVWEKNNRFISLLQSYTCMTICFADLTARF